MLKKAMDIVDTYAWVQTCSRKLVECFVDNAYRYKYAWILKLRCKGETAFLKVEPGQRIHLSRAVPEAKEVDKFSQYLRAHVRDGKVVEVSMPWWERVVVLEVAKGSQRTRHYIELVPRGLWVVAGLDNRVLYASRFEEFKDRAIKPGLEYKPPPPRGLPPTSSEELLKAIQQGRDLVRAIVSGWGLPGYIAEELLLRSGLYEEKNRKPGELPRSSIEAIVSEYSRLVKEALEGKGYLVYGSSGLELYTPYRPRLFEEVYDRQVQRIEFFEEALDKYFTELEAQEEALARARELEKELEAWKKRISEQEAAVEEYKRELEALTRQLSTIYENYSYIESLLECARKAHDEEGWDAVKSCGVVGYDERNGLVFIEVAGEKLAFSIRESLATQVVKLEKQKGELEKKLSKAIQVLEELKSKSLEVEKELAVKVYSKPSPRFWYERYRWTITRNGFLVIAGRDASQNEVVVKKYLGESNVFLHADVHGAPATVLLKQSRELGQGDIEDAAVIAACYSRAWKAGFSYVDVYWVRGSQVSKSPPSGEYLAKGAFMVYGERNYLRVPLVLGIGLRLFCDEVYGEYYKVYVGSPEVVKSTSVAYVLIVPGSEDPSKASLEISKLLSELALRKAGVRIKVSASAVQELLPGSLRVIESGVGNGRTSCEE